MHEDFPPTFSSQMNEIPNPFVSSQIENSIPFSVEGVGETRSPVSSIFKDIDKVGEPQVKITSINSDDDLVDFGAQNFDDNFQLDSPSQENEQDDKKQKIKKPEKIVSQKTAQESVDEITAVLQSRFESIQFMPGNIDRSSFRSQMLDSVSQQLEALKGDKHIQLLKDYINETIDSYSDQLFSPTVEEDEVETLPDHSDDSDMISHQLPENEDTNEERQIIEDSQQSEKSKLKQADLDVDKSQEETVNSIPEMPKGDQVPSSEIFDEYQFGLTLDETDDVENNDQVYSDTEEQKDIIPDQEEVSDASVDEADLSHTEEIEVSNIQSDVENSLSEDDEQIDIKDSENSASVDEEAAPVIETIHEFEEPIETPVDEIFDDEVDKSARDIDEIVLNQDEYPATEEEVFEESVIDEAQITKEMFEDDIDKQGESQETDSEDEIFEDVPDESDQNIDNDDDSKQEDNTMGENIDDDMKFASYTIEDTPIQKDESPRDSNDENVIIADINEDAEENIKVFEQMDVSEIEDVLLEDETNISPHQEDHLDMDVSSDQTEDIMEMIDTQLFLTERDFKNKDFADFAYFQKVMNERLKTVFDNVDDSLQIAADSLALQKILALHQDWVKRQSKNEEDVQESEETIEDISVEDISRDIDNRMEEEDSVEDVKEEKEEKISLERKEKKRKEQKIVENIISKKIQELVDEDEKNLPLEEEVDEHAQSLEDNKGNIIFDYKAFLLEEEILHNSENTNLEPVLRRSASQISLEIFDLLREESLISEDIVLDSMTIDLLLSEFFKNPSLHLLQKLIDILRNHPDALHFLWKLLSFLHSQNRFADLEYVSQVVSVFLVQGVNDLATLVERFSDYVSQVFSNEILIERCITNITVSEDHVENIWDGMLQHFHDTLKQLRQKEESMTKISFDENKQSGKNFLRLHLGSFSQTRTKKFIIENSL